MPTWSSVLEEIQEEQDTRASAFDEVRRRYLRKVHQETGRPAILYSSGWNDIDADSPEFSLTESDVQGFMQTISGIQSEDLDLIIHSPGGSSEVTEQIVEYLREKFSHIRVIVPQAAMSAATLLCCAADEVMMGHHSSLGPTDPQMLIPTKTGRRWVPAQTIIDQFEEIEEQAQRGDEIAHYTPILGQYDPGLKQEAENAVELTDNLAKNWAEKYMFDGDPNAESLARDLANHLSNHSNFLSHSRRLSKRHLEENTEMNVSSLEDNQDLQDAVLSVFHAVTATHDHQQITKIIENHNGKMYGKQLS